MALFITEDGSHSVFSELFGVAYHSTHGAIQETKHIFIEAALNYYIKNKSIEKIKILDIGFGTGLNVYMTFLESLKLACKIDLTTIEAYPLSISIVEQLNFPRLLQVPQYEPLFKLLHTSNWEEKHELTHNFIFQKRLLDFKDIVYINTFDVIYYDAFSPNSQPELWESDTLQCFFDALVEGGILTTYCAKGSFKRALKQVGFRIENIPGPKGKREMTRAIKTSA
jgi:tRNA U34 5-methylaminomethyl-2-thiouridine-forming methyltransferase MnmC